MLIGEGNAGDRCHHGYHGYRNTEHYLHLPVATALTAPRGPMSGGHVFAPPKSVVTLP
jgi:hypothetical protein